MSLIEQAAKRLEELRRAGADIGGDAVVDAPREATTFFFLVGPMGGLFLGRGGGFWGCPALV